MTAVHRSTVQGKALSDTTGGCSGTHLFDSHDLSRVLVLCLIHSSKLRGGRGERKRETGVTTAEWRPAAPSRQAQRRRLELGLLQRHCGGRRSPDQPGPARPAPPAPPSHPSEGHGGHAAPNSCSPAPPPRSRVSRSAWHEPAHPWLPSGKGEKNSRPE